MNQNAVATNAVSVEQRPTLLKVLCILTFIATGLGVLFAILGAIGLTAMSGNMGTGGEIASSAGVVIAIPGIVFAIAKGYGAWQMWQLKKVGFFIYAGAAVATLIVTPIVTSVVLGIGFELSTMPIIVTAAFIGLYYTNLKVLK